MVGEDLVIERCLNTEEKLKAIQLCGNAFAIPMHERDGFSEYFQKIDSLACFLIAKRKNIISGFSAFYMNDQDNKTAFLSLIAVAPQVQGNNIGAVLLNESEKLARENGMRRMFLKVRCDNQKAIRFYEKHGYMVEFIKDEEYLPGSKEWGGNI